MVVFANEDNAPKIDEAEKLTGKSIKVKSLLTAIVKAGILWMILPEKVPKQKQLIHLQMIRYLCSLLPGLRDYPKLYAIHSSVSHSGTLPRHHGLD